MMTEEKIFSKNNNCNNYGTIDEISQSDKNSQKMDKDMYTMREMSQSYENIQKGGEKRKIIEILQKSIIPESCDIEYYRGVFKACDQIYKSCTLNQKDKIMCALAMGKACKHIFELYDENNSEKNFTKYSAPSSQKCWSFYYESIENINIKKDINKINQLAEELQMDLLVPFNQGIIYAMETSTIPNEKSVHFYYGMYKAHSHMEPCCKLANLDLIMIPLTIKKLCANIIKFNEFKVCI